MGVAAFPEFWPRRLLSAMTFASKEQKLEEGLFVCGREKTGGTLLQILNHYTSLNIIQCLIMPWDLCDFIGR
jgi:hypothetical protein